MSTGTGRSTGPPSWCCSLRQPVTQGGAGTKASAHRNWKQVRDGSLTYICNPAHIPCHLSQLGAKLTCPSQTTAAGFRGSPASSPNHIGSPCSPI